MKAAGLHLHALPQPSSAVDLASQQPVFVILRRVVSRWNTTAKVVAVHDDEAVALADLATFRNYEPQHTFAIFVLYPEEGAAS